MHRQADVAKPRKRVFFDEASFLAACCNLVVFNGPAGYSFRVKAIPKGAWRLQLLSDRPLLPLEDSTGIKEGVSDSSPGAEKSVSAGGEGVEAGQEGATTVVSCQDRAVYGGVYVPNKYLLFFRYTIAEGRCFARKATCFAQKTVHHQRFASVQEAFG